MFFVDPCSPCKLKDLIFKLQAAGACPVHMVTRASSSIPDFGSLLLLQIWGQVECLIPVGSRLSCLQSDEGRGPHSKERPGLQAGHRTASLDK